MRKYEELKLPFLYVLFHFVMNIIILLMYCSSTRKTVKTDLFSLSHGILMDNLVTGVMAFVLTAY